MTGLGARLDDIEALYGEVREETATVDLSALRAKYDADPIGFIRTVLHGDPWADKQVEIGELIKTEDQIVVQSCNGAGKDWLAARLAIWAATMGWQVLITGPTERQVKHVLMDDIYAAWKRATPKLGGELRELGWRIDRGDKAGIVAFTATDTSRITGLHAPRQFAILTEGQDQKIQHVYEGIRKCLTGAVTRFLVLGNPVAPEGEFHRICHSPGWRKVHIAAEDCPNVRTGRNVVEGGIDRKFIARQAADYGTESPVYRTSVLGLFSEQAGAEELIYPRALRETARGRWAGASAAGEVTLGVDVGAGGDKSAVAPLRGSRIEEVRVWNVADTMVTVGRVVLMAKQYGVRPAEGPTAENGMSATAKSGTIVVDANGIGLGVADRLAELGYRVVRFMAQRAAPKPAKDRPAFGNLKAAAHWRLRELLDAGLGIPTDQRLEEEMAAVHYQPGSSGKIYVEEKRDVKKTLGRSPDGLEAVVLACWKESGYSGLGTVASW